MILFNLLSVHCCLFDRECWQIHRDYGMPFRIHIFPWPVADDREERQKQRRKSITITLYEGRRSRRNTRAMVEKLKAARANDD